MNDLAALYRLIKHFEGCRLMPYICPAGVWTCGWGSTGFDVFPGQPWTQEYADKRLEMDAQKFAKGVLLASPTVQGDTLCALADFAYNLGVGAYRGSTLRKRIDAGAMDAARHEIKRWVYAGGKVLPGLVLRRAAEAALL